MPKVLFFAALLFTLFFGLAVVTPGLAATVLPALVTAVFVGLAVMLFRMLQLMA